jgi:hypothetical protein
MNGIRKNMFLVAALVVFVFAFTVFADSDPPDRVARLNLIEGSVSYHPSGGNDDDWVSAVQNRPLTTGDRLWADANSRSELHIGSTAVRMDSNTGISFLNLDSTNVQIRLSSGSINIKLRNLAPEDSFEVDTPNQAFAIRRPGNYRIDVNSDANTTVITAWQGEGEAIGGGRSWQVISNQQVLLTGNSTLDYDLKDAGDQRLSDFDRWARNRDTREDRAVSKQYVSREMTGYEDLDAYGSWRQIQDYGWCWTPTRVAADWAPYRNGHWVWVAPWGWTWVDDAPWGFAPFHYGRWAHLNSAWFWVPGPIVARPVYAPALVAWVGGSGFSFSVSIGSGGGIGWFPLGPREVFIPTYHVSEKYVTNINITNTVVTRTTIVNVYKNPNVRTVYMNRTVPSAVTIVSHNTFVNARPIAQNIVRLRERELETAPISRMIDLVPERSSVFGAGKRNASHPPEKLMNLSVIAKQAPPAEPNHFKRVMETGKQNMPTPSNPPRTAPPQSNPPRIAPPQSEPPRTVPPQSNPPRTAPPQSEPPRTAPPRTTPTRNEPTQRPTFAPPERSVAPGSPNIRSERPPQTAPERTMEPREGRTLVRPAPPVREATPKEKSDADAKRKVWEKLQQKKAERPDKGKDSK